MKTRVLGLMIIGSLTGCASSFSGLSGSSSSLSCKAPAGVICSSVSGIYANSLKDALPAQQKKTETPVVEASDSKVVKTNPPKKVEEKAKSTEAESLPPHALRTLSSGMPVRSAPYVLRVWVAPWEDADGDLHDQHYLFAVVNHGKWQLEVNQERIRSQFRPVYPLKRKDEDKGDALSQQTEPLSSNSQSETTAK